MACQHLSLSAAYYSNPNWQFNEYAGLLRNSNSSAVAVRPAAKAGEKSPADLI